MLSNKHDFKTELIIQIHTISTLNIGIINSKFWNRLIDFSFMWYFSWYKKVNISKAQSIFVQLHRQEAIKDNIF